MKRGLIVAIVVSWLLVLVFPIEVQAASGKAVVTFRLQVSGHPDGNITFWAAYGPLAGHFYVTRLHPAGNG